VISSLTNASLLPSRPTTDSCSFDSSLQLDLVRRARGGGDFDGRVEDERLDAARARVVLAAVVERETDAQRGRARRERAQRESKRQSKVFRSRAQGLRVAADERESFASALDGDFVALRRGRVEVIARRQRDRHDERRVARHGELLRREFYLFRIRPGGL